MSVVEDGKELHDLIWTLRKNQNEMKTWRSLQEDVGHGLMIKKNVPKLNSNVNKNHKKWPKVLSLQQNTICNILGVDKNGGKKKQSC